MTLREVLEQIDSFSPDASIYVADRGNLDDAALVHLSDDGDPPERLDGMPLVMDVWQVKETLDGLANLLRRQTGTAPSHAELFDRFLVYLKNDA